MSDHSRVRDAITSDVLRISDQLNIGQLAELLARTRLEGAVVVRCEDESAEVLGVVDASGLMAVLSSLDLVPAAAGVDDGFFTGDHGLPPELAVRFAHGFEPACRQLDERSVTDVMDRTIHTIRSDAPLDEAARQMDTFGIERILVTESGGLRGQIARRDLGRSS